MRGSGRRHEALAGEIRRTIAAVRQQLGEEQVSRVILCGNAADADEAQALASDLGLAVEMFDVAQNAPSGLAKASLPADSLGRFAAVIGMALGEADRRAPVVDFLHVRRRAAERQFTRQHGLLVAAAALVVIFFGLVLWKRYHDVTRELAQVNEQTTQAQQEFARLQFQKTLDQTTSIERWLATDVNWLDELDRLSNQWRPESLDSKTYPAAEDAVVTDLTLGRGVAKEGGLISIQAVARNPQVVATLEKRLRDEAHQVDTIGGKTDSSVPGYGWSFPLTMDVVPADEAPETTP